MQSLQVNASNVEENQKRNDTIKTSENMMGFFPLWVSLWTLKGTYTSQFTRNAEDINPPTGQPAKLKKNSWKLKETTCHEREVTATECWPLCLPLTTPPLLPLHFVMFVTESENQEDQGSENCSPLASPSPSLIGKHEFTLGDTTLTSLWIVYYYFHKAVTTSNMLNREHVVCRDYNQYLLPELYNKYVLKEEIMRMKGNQRKTWLQNANMISVSFLWVRWVYLPISSDIKQKSL